MANNNFPKVKDRTIDRFKSKLTGGGARPNLFECEMYFPDDAVPSTTSKDDLSDKVRFLVKAAQLPASTLTNIEVPFRGRQLKIAGTRTYAPWTITVINDIDFNIRTAFERWSNLINKHEFGNGTSIYTSNGAFARNFMKNVQIGMVGINIPIPVPMSFYTFGGWKGSIFGGHGMHGEEGINFYTKRKTITSRWPDDVAGASLNMPTMK